MEAAPVEMPGAVSLGLVASSWSLERRGRESAQLRAPQKQAEGDDGSTRVRACGANFCKWLLQVQRTCYF